MSGCEVVTADRRLPVTGCAGLQSQLVLLARSAESADAEGAEGFVFCLSSGRAFAPELERARSELCSHELDDFARSQAELAMNGFKGRSIFPGHLDDSVDVGIRQSCVIR